MRLIRKSLSAALLASVALLALALPVSASQATPAAPQQCYPPSAGCVSAIEVNPGTVNPGGTFTVTVTDHWCAANVPYTVTLTDRSNQQVASYSGNTTAAGGIQATFTLPSSVTPGTYTVTATAVCGGQSQSLSGSLTVVSSTGGTTVPGRPGGSTTPLPRTGASTWPKVWVGGGLVVVGLVAVVLTTWRRREAIEA